MRPDTILRYALAAAFMLAGSGWLADANAQQRVAPEKEALTTSAPDDPIGRAEAPGALTIAPRTALPATPLRGGTAVEGFENGFPPEGWEIVDVSGTGTWGTNISSLRALNSPTSAFFNDFTGDQDDWLISAPYDFSSFDQPTLYYFENVNFSSFAADQLVKISTDYDGNGDPSTATWITVNDAIGPEDAFDRVGIDLSEYTNEASVYVAFHYIGNFAAEWYIDNVFISEQLPDQVAPECPVSLMPADGSTVEPGPSGVLLSWAPATTDPANSAYPTIYGVNFGAQTPPTDIENFNAQGANAIFTGAVDFNTTYYYSITAFNAAGVSESCPIVSFTTSEAPEPPPNDDIANATLIEGDGSYMGTNVNATAQENEPDPSCTTGGNVTSVYWTFTPAEDTAVTIDASGSDFDTVLTLHLADATEVACDDDGGDGLTSLLEDVAVTGGTQYLVRFAGFGDSAAGNIAFDLAGLDSGGGDPVSLPITFEDENVNYDLVDFPDDGSGPASTIVVDPEDMNNMAVESVYPAEPACFAGTTVANEFGFTEPIPFAPGETTMSIRVWSPEAGVRVRFKVEKFDDPTVSVESDEFTTVAGAWETLEYDFTDQVPGTAEINFESEYTKASIFFGFSCGIDPTASGGNTYYWDDIAFGGGGTGSMTIAEARAAGDGAEVMVTGVVSRSKGDFTYIQDETAGLTIRQTEGAFFDDVAAGVIAPGVEVTISGTLSTFRGLLQINEGNLASYSVGSAGDVPAPVAISVQELNENGENYEGELVQIDDLTTPSMGMFDAGTNYDATDETATGILRVPNADDSDVDGTPIPDGAFTFTGVVGQFTFADPANDGYQLLAINEGDVEAQMGGGDDQVSLPITFEDENVNYDLVDFPDDGSGPASTIVVDPEDMNNMAVESVYPAEPACFAGTTVANEFGFTEPIPFSEGNTMMNLRVWSPEAGVRVRFKVEKFDDPTVSVESDEFTTVAGAWETLEYDFTDQVPGTAEINFESEYTKASIFFGFSCGIDPTASGGNTYYWDDIAFGPADPGGDGDIAFSPSPLMEMLLSGETGTETVTLTNNTDGEVAFDFSQYSGDGGTLKAPPTSGEPSLELGKGESDPRGYTQSFGAGGPDAFGYEWIDSNEPGGPAFEAIDISSTGTELTEADFDSEACSFGPLDEGNALVELPFTFSFYGEDYSAVKVNINGNLNFNADGEPIPCSFTNDPLPDAGTPNGGLIAPLWDDFDIGPEGATGGQIFTETLPDGRFVVQYDNVEKFANDTEANTFQVILSPSGAIKYQYILLNSTAFSYSIGIENPDGSIGLEVAMGSDYAEPGLAVLIQARPSFVTGVSPATGTIPAGGSAAVDVDFSAEGLLGGTYEGSLTVDTDLMSDPSSFDLPVVLEVTGVAECAIMPDPVEFGEVIVGFSTSEEVSVMNSGTDACELTGASADGPFSVESFEPVTLDPGASASFFVVYTPTEAGDDNGTLTVATDGDALTAALAGTALEPPSFSVDPTELSFMVEEGMMSDAQSVTLSNDGAGAGSFSVSIANSVVRGIRPAFDNVDPIVTLNGPAEAMVFAQFARSSVVRSSANVTVTQRSAARSTARATAPSAGRGAAGTSDGVSTMMRGGGSPGDLIAQTGTVVGIGGIGQTADGTIYVCDLSAQALTETFTYDVDSESYTSTGSYVQPGTPGTNITGCTYFPDGNGGNGAIWYLNADLGAGAASFIETDLDGSPTGAVVPISAVGPGITPIGLSYSESTGLFFFLDIAGDDILAVGTDGALADGFPVPQTCLDDGAGLLGNALDALGEGLDVAVGTIADGRPTRAQVTEFDGSCREDEGGDDLFTPLTVGPADAFINGVLRDRRAPNEVIHIADNTSATLFALVPAEREDIGSFVVVSPESGTVEAGGSQEISVSIDATDLEPGDYSAQLVIETNDPANPTLVVDLDIEVMPAVSNEETGVPTAFALDQNYPNPFAGSTTIDYAVPEAARVVITVYDAVGRRVAVVVDEDRTPGYHSATWDTRGLASGVYLYRIQAGDYVETKKMSLVR